MNKRYERYIDYIVSDLQPPYFENMVDNYGLSPNEYPLVLSKLFNQPVTIKGDYVYNEQGNKIYWEDSNGSWRKIDYDDDGNLIYYENSTGYWHKYEYDENGYQNYYEGSNGSWWKKEYNSNGDILYYEDSDGYIEDNR